MTTLIEQQITKMGLIDEPNIVEKTTELVRLLELRSTNVPLQINEYGKIVLCADLAATMLGIAFDKEQALKLSGLKKSHYTNNKRMIEKLLDLNKLVGVNDICIQLSLQEVKKKADELLELYRKVIASEQTEVDDTHPQYASMAVFMACKLCQKKISKTKIMPFSNLRPAQFQQLEQRWEKLIAKHYKNTMDNKLKVQDSEESDKVEEKRCPESKRERFEIEDYGKWKKRMLAMAQAKLKQEEGVNDKENELEGENDQIILGC
ncbi:origin recognition complex subunit 6 [Stomoxys calcitrans]|uniref:Origin recognition complex subunit 6 n=1 Tax=Stomoxys calcitrans TaxID=35570 RepID=A0A1I8P103_STOCA|nr:origin recognition complex subunit 6 [Stomoxys calcitrans]